MKKRILALSLAAAMLVGAMASCNAKAEVVSSAVEARDISLVFWGSENDQAFLKEVTAEWATKYAADHEDVKSVTVDVQIKGEDVAKTDALNDITAAADIFGTANDGLSELSAASAIYPMPESIQKEIKDIVGDLAFSTTLCDGQYYGFPYSPNTANILWYNKSMLTEEDVKTMEGILGKEGLGDVAPLIANISTGWDGMTWYATAGAELYTNEDKTVNTLASDECASMIEWLAKQIADKKIVHAGSNTDAAAMLKDGKAAALLFQDWAQGDFKDALGENFAVTELPTLNGQHMKCFGGSKLLVINANCKEADAALDLCKYMITEDVQLRRFKAVGTTPTVPALASNEDVATDPIAAANAKQANYIVVNCPLNGKASYWSLMEALMTDVRDGKITDAATAKTKLEELVATMTENVNK